MPPPERWVLYVDLDAFYVSCEVRDRPDLAGRPVIVGPPPSEGPTRGVVLSASYEARAFGVRSAQPVAQAARLCPEAVWVRPDFAKYEHASLEVLELLRRHAGTVLPYSIDESALLVEGVHVEQARELAREIQTDLRESLHLPASIGVATHRLLAKVASDRAKPGGIVVVPPDEAAAFLAPLPVRTIPGVGPKTEELLQRLGIERVGDLAGAPVPGLRRSLGSFGDELRALARGRPRAETIGPSGPRSRSTDRTFPQDVAEWEALETSVRELAGELARSLEREGMRFGAVGVALRWSDFSRSQRVRSLPAAQEGVAPLTENAVHLARELWEAEHAGRGRPVRTLSVRTERLVERTQRQASLDSFLPSSSRGRPEE